MTPPADDARTPPERPQREKKTAVGCSVTAELTSPATQPDRPYNSLHPGGVRAACLNSCPSQPPPHQPQSTARDRGSPRRLGNGIKAGGNCSALLRADWPQRRERARRLFPHLPACAGADTTGGERRSGGREPKDGGVNTGAARPPWSVGADGRRRRRTAPVTSR